MDSREAIAVAGLPLAAAFFRHLDPVCTIEMLVQDGQSVMPGTALMRIAGNARVLLTAERSALNTVQHLSGIATMTRAYVDAMLQSVPQSRPFEPFTSPLPVMWKKSVKCEAGGGAAVPPSLAGGGVVPPSVAGGGVTTGPPSVAGGGVVPASSAGGSCRPG
jgi:nicotinate-nucleotide pyrophosphorylase